MNSQITVMNNDKNITNTDNPLAGGLENLRVHDSNFEDYLSNQFCLSCTYFQITKGHFGFCKEKPTKPYDGSKLGSACLAYRMKSELIGKEKKSNIIPITSIRRNYNAKVKPVKSALELSIGKTKPTNFAIDKEFIHGVPYSTTSPIRNKSGFYRHKTSARIIEYAIWRMERGDSLSSISKRINQVYGYKISKTTIWHWSRKFKPELNFPQQRPHTKEMNTKISESLKKYFKTHSIKGRGKGISKKRKWMLELQAKYKDIPLMNEILDNELKQFEKPMEIKNVR